MVVPGMPTHVQGATGCGNLEILRYAHENGCPWDAQTCSHAADGGHLQVLQYAHDYGCPWGAETCKRAAAKGHLQVLQYAHYSVECSGVYACCSQRTFTSSTESSYEWLSLDFSVSDSIVALI